MFTKEQVKELNQNLPTVDIKGKKYVMVKEKIKAFRELCPLGVIETTLLGMENGLAIIKATVRDEDGNLLGTGHACEKEGSSQVNSTSWLENAETSAIGRAIGNATGLGIDDSFGSADEVANAILQQGENAPASPAERKVFEDYCRRLNVSPTEILAKTGWKKGQKMTKEHHGKALIILNDIAEAEENA